MRKKRARRTNQALQPQKKGRRFFLHFFLILALLGSGMALGWWSSPPRTGGDEGKQTSAPDSLQAGAPAKEYIYAGSRLVAAEQRAVIFPTSESFPANGGTGIVDVSLPAGVQWTAISNDSWITVTSGHNGSGQGQVAYSVSARTDPQSSTSNRTGTITIAGTTFTVAQGMVFSDVPVGHTFYNEIGKLSARGVTLGCGGGFYCVDANVNREQMAAFIIRAVGLPNPPMPPFQRFTDVPPPQPPPGNPFYAFIDQMAVKQITLGCTLTTYCPTADVLHDQMAAFIMRARGEFTPPPQTVSSFADVPAGSIFHAFIERMDQLQIWTGCGTNQQGQRIYCPANPVTRGQMAAILVRAFNL